MGEFKINDLKEEVRLLLLLKIERSMQGENIKIEPHGILKGKLPLTQAMEIWSPVFRLELRPTRTSPEKRRAGPSSCRAPETRNSSSGSTPDLKKKRETLRTKLDTPFTPSQATTISSRMLLSPTREGMLLLPAGIRLSVFGISRITHPLLHSSATKRMSSQLPSLLTTDRSSQAQETKP